jgi:beta-glucosidase
VIPEPQSSAASCRWPPHARLTFSADGSAPTAGDEVGIVVVGESPYAEGHGRRREQRAHPEPHGRGPALVDKVGAAIRICVVLLVSGRPLVVTDSFGDIDALVASWLPGSEGTGVAGVLSGRQPLTCPIPSS